MRRINPSNLLPTTLPSNRKIKNQRIFKNKKAEILAPETLKIIISLICIVILVYLLVSIYYASINKQKLLQAKSTMEKINEIVNKIKIDSSYVGNITEITPADWMIFSYSGNAKKPNQCMGQNCLCICDEVWVDNLYIIKDRQINKCSKSGVCEVFKTLKDFGKIKIKEASNPTSIKISEVNKLIEVQEI